MQAEFSKVKIGQVGFQPRMLETLNQKFPIAGGAHLMGWDRFCAYEEVIP